MTPHGGVVVLGGGLAGLLAASVLAEVMGEVTIVERDRLPEGPAPRKGVPQAHHGHLLLPGGVTALEELLPGTIDELDSHGALRLGLPGDIVELSGQGWMPRSANLRFAVSCSRSLLDWVVRQRVLRDRRIEMIEATDAEQLCGDRHRVTGARVRHRKTGQQTHLDADLVVDATGMASRTPTWLSELGLPQVREEIVDSGLAYSTRLYLAPPGTRGRFPAVFVRANPGTGEPGHGGSILPIEKGQWLVTLSGTRGTEPPTDIDGFERFAESLRHGIIAELIAGAESMGGVRGYRNNMNRRRHFPQLPDGFVALGDAVTATNPLYAHGMSLAANSAIALRDGLARYGLRQGGGARVQREIARAGHVAWRLATSQDILYPHAIGRGRRSDVLRKRVTDRLQRLAAQDPDVLAALLKGRSLSGSFSGLLRPKVVRGLLRGAPAMSSGEAPLSIEERVALQEAGRWSA